MKTPSGRAYETDVAIPARPGWRAVVAGLAIVLAAMGLACGVWKL